MWSTSLCGRLAKNDQMLDECKIKERIAAWNSIPISVEKGIL